jgi:hypothetical protein
VSGGSPGLDTLVEQRFRWPIYAHAVGTVAINRRACTPSTAKVPLSSAGLQANAPGPLGREFDCEAPRRVLVRVRAVFRSPAPLYQDRFFLKTRRPVRDGYLAVRTQAGAPLVFQTVSESGRSRLFTARSCVED